MKIVLCLGYRSRQNDPGYMLSFDSTRITFILFHTVLFSKHMAINAINYV